MKLPSTWSFRTHALRPVARMLALLYTLSLGVPLALAEDQSVYFSNRLNTRGRERYIDHFYSDMALWETLQKQNQTNQDRQRQYQEHLDYWQKMQTLPPPRGQNPSTWRQQVDGKVRQFQGYLQTQQEHTRRTAERLQTQIQRMQRHDRTIRQTQDDLVKQSLGTVIGVAGMTRWVAPINPTVNPTTGAMVNPGRITAGEIGGTLQQGGRIVARGAIGNNPARLDALGGRIRGWGEAAGAARAELPTQGRSLLSGLFGWRQSPGLPPGAQTVRTWEAFPSNAQGGAGQYVLRQVDMTVQNGQVTGRTPVQGGREIPTGTAVNRRTTAGEWVKIDSAEAYARGLAMNRQAVTQLRQNATDLRLQAREMAGTRVGSQLEARAAQLEARAQNLDQKITEYRTNNPNQLANRARYLAGSAAKWAAFSAGMAVTMRAIESYRQNGEIDWSYATQDLRSRQFWTGTGGAFLGSMAGSAIMSGVTSVIPGGPLVKAGLQTFGAIAGSAIGFQAGSGNLSNTDWTHLAATTIGATIGSMLLAPLGPVGVILGGIVGNIVADWALRTFRAWGELEATAANPRGPPPGFPGTPSGPVGPGSGGGGWVGPDQDQADQSSSIETPSIWDQQVQQQTQDPVYALKDELDRLRAEFIAAQQSGDRQRQMQLFQEIRRADQALRAAKYAAGRR